MIWHQEIIGVCDQNDNRTLNYLRSLKYKITFMMHIFDDLEIEDPFEYLVRE